MRAQDAAVYCKISSKQRHGSPDPEQGSKRKNECEDKQCQGKFGDRILKNQADKNAGVREALANWTEISKAEHTNTMRVNIDAARVPIIVMAVAGSNPTNQPFSTSIA